MEKTKLLAVLGLPGSGKTEVINYIEKKYKFPNVYIGQPTFDRLKEKGLEINPQNEKIAREELRHEYGMASHAILSLPKIEKLMGTTKVILLESMYSWEEYLIFKEKYQNNFITLAINSCPKTRKKRLQNRAIRPLKNSQEFLDRDYSQIEKLNQAGPIVRADWTIINEDSLETLHKNIEKALEKLNLKTL
ncbi:AAA family ATPase [Patescibacteria group bacterium]|nr:AAA family ATPase [Patescibacteria group bacterium]